MTGISSLQKEFATSLAYFDLTDADASVEKEISNKINMFIETLGGSTTVQDDSSSRTSTTRQTRSTTTQQHEPTNGPLFLLINYLYAAMCYHYEDLDSRLSSRNRLRTTPLFLDTSSEIRKYAKVKYPWNKTVHTPVFTGIPPHVLIMAELERLQHILRDHRSDIIGRMTEELDRRNVGGENFAATQVLDQITQVQQTMMEVLNNHSKGGGGGGGRRDGGGGRRNDGLSRHNLDFINQFLVVDEDEQMDLDEEDTSSTTSGSGVYVDGNLEKTKPRGIMISWGNCRNGNIKIVPKTFQFPSMTLSGLIRMWYCGDVQKNIPPYKMLRPCDIQHIKYGPSKLSNMKSVMSQVKRATKLINKPHLIKFRMNSEDTMVLYQEIKHLFHFENMGKTRRIETIAWKTYYNIITKRKGKLLGETDNEEDDDDRDK